MISDCATPCGYTRDELTDQPVSVLVPPGEHIEPLSRHMAFRPLHRGVNEVAMVATPPLTVSGWLLECRGGLLRFPDRSLRLAAILQTSRWYGQAIHGGVPSDGS